MSIEHSNREEVTAAESRIDRALRDKNSPEYAELCARIDEWLEIAQPVLDEIETAGRPSARDYAVIVY